MTHQLFCWYDHVDVSFARTLQRQRAMARHLKSHGLAHMVLKDGPMPRLSPVFCQLSATNNRIAVESALLSHMAAQPAAGGLWYELTVRDPGYSSTDPARFPSEKAQQSLLERVRDLLAGSTSMAAATVRSAWCVREGVDPHWAISARVVGKAIGGEAPGSKEARLSGYTLLGQPVIEAATLRHPQLAVRKLCEGMVYDYARQHSYDPAGLNCRESALPKHARDGLLEALLHPRGRRFGAITIFDHLERPRCEPAAKKVDHGDDW